MKRFCRVILFCILLFVAITFFNVQAADCVIGQNLSGKSESELNEIINKCEAKKNELNKQANTLSTQIQYMDTQIYLTALQIQETEQKIINTEKEIGLLGSRIEGLDQSLDYLSKLLINRIVEGYKKKPFSIFSLLFDNKNANDFLNQVKYLKTAQTNNQKLLYTVQETKTNYEEQKKLREEKKTELDKLTEALNYQKQSLNNQKGQKQKLLADTQNDESTYQRLLAQAQAQLAGFKSFIQSSGANSVIAANAFGTGSDNAYYSQRDARWANQTIGGSSENILSVGCLLTSVSMVLKKNGVDTNPSIIASNSDYFSLNTAFMNYRWRFNPWPAGLNSYQISTSQIDDELNAGHYVIVGVGGCTNGGSHYVVLTKKDGDDYIMHDPIYGPDIKFSSHYSNICSSETFK